MDLRSAVRGGTRAGRSATLPLSLALVAVVVIIAGTVGTAHFGGPRWYPRISAGKQVPPKHFAKAPGGAKLPPVRPASGRAEWPLILGIVVGALIVAYVLYRLWSLRRMPAMPNVSTAGLANARLSATEPEPLPEPEALLTGIEAALAALEDGREPSDAIVRAWLGLQETAEESGIVRRASETPTEFTSRVMNSAFADDASIRTLLRLYLRTRFGDHAVTAEDVAAVRGALAQLVDGWRALERRKVRP